MHKSVCLLDDGGIVIEPVERYGSRLSPIGLAGRVVVR
jgi:hypothetical protein